MIDSARKLCYHDFYSGRLDALSRFPCPAARRPNASAVSPIQGHHYGFKEDLS